MISANFPLLSALFYVIPMKKESPDEKAPRNKYQGGVPPIRYHRHVVSRTLVCSFVAVTT